MAYLLDTNILSQLLRRHPDRRVVERLQCEPSERLFTSCICVMELRHGAVKLKDQGELWGRIEHEILSGIETLPLGISEAILAGDLLAHLRASGKTIDVEDVLIGVTALRNDLTLVTNNIKHFARIPHLRVEDWLA
jgi:predicted nucleic acid-binding protein